LLSKNIKIKLYGNIYIYIFFYIREEIRLGIFEFTVRRGEIGVGEGVKRGGEKTA